ncbi:uncharacterized protein UTRI_00139 [Ustilago trichophora]|uniref:Uncharacterized protein n=1 Tax=Ustilago trichophora TaxID=86804 RepID=A0A5C3DQI9_9BASI|nr:uncharacterized protein UTRI_00139 [Ustilago trichophora]
MRIWTPSQGPARRSVSSDGRALEPYYEDSWPGWTFDQIYDIPRWDGGDKAACPPQHLTVPSKSNLALDSVGNPLSHRKGHKRRAAAQKIVSDFCLHGNAPVPIPDASICKTGHKTSEMEGKLDKRAIPSFSQIQEIVNNGIDAGRQIRLARLGAQGGGVGGEAAGGLSADPIGSQSTALSMPGTGGLGSMGVPGGLMEGLGGISPIPGFGQIQQIVDKGIEAGKEVKLARLRAQAAAQGPGAGASPQQAGGSPASPVGIPSTPLARRSDDSSSSPGIDSVLKLMTTGFKGFNLGDIAGNIFSSLTNPSPTDTDIPVPKDKGPTTEEIVSKSLAEEDKKSAASGGAEQAQAPATAPPPKMSRRSSSSNKEFNDHVLNFVAAGLDTSEQAPAKLNDVSQVVNADFVPPAFSSLSNDAVSSLVDVVSGVPNTQGAASELIKRSPLGPMMMAGPMMMGGAGGLQAMMPLILAGIEAGGKVGVALLQYMKETDTEKLKVKEAEAKNGKLKGKDQGDDSKSKDDDSDLETGPIGAVKTLLSGGVKDSDSSAGSNADTETASGTVTSDASGAAGTTGATGAAGTTSNVDSTLSTAGSGETGGSLPGASGTILSAGTSASNSPGTGSGSTDDTSSTGGLTSSSLGSSSLPGSSSSSSPLSGLGSSSSSGLTGSSGSSSGASTGSTPGSSSSLAGSSTPGAGTSPQSYTPGLAKRDGSHTETPHSSIPPTTLHSSSSDATAECGGTAKLCMQLIEHAFPYCHSSKPEERDATQQPKKGGRNFGKASSKLVKVMSVHCSLKCDGFSEMAEAKSGFKAKAERCVGDRWLFSKIHAQASTRHDFTPKSDHHPDTSSHNHHHHPILPKRDLLHSPNSKSSTQGKCQSGYGLLFSNAMRPVPSYNNKLFGSVVSDPISFLHWGLVRSVSECLHACDATDGCVFANIYQQTFSLDDPEIRLVTRHVGSKMPENKEVAGAGIEAGATQGLEAGKDAVGVGEDKRKIFAQKPEQKKNSFVQGHLTCALYSRCHLECEANHGSAGGNPVFFEHSAGYCKSQACLAAM